MSIAIAPDPRIKIRVDAVCHTCGVRHKIECSPSEFHRHSWDWYVKHDPRLHDVEYYSVDRVLPRGMDERPYEKVDVAPWYLEYRENADIKIAYAASAQITLGLHATPLASSSTFAAGRESAAIDNKTTVKYLDYRVAGKATTGTTPTTAKSIRVYAYASVNDTPTYPDTLDGTDSDESLTSADMLAALAFLGSTQVDATSNRTYWFSALRSIALAFGFVPTHWGLYVAHDTVAALNSTDTNHAFHHTGMYVTSA